MELARKTLNLCHWAERWAPFRFHGTALAPAELLSAKLLVSYFLLSKGDFGGEVFLPFWLGLDRIPIDPSTLRAIIWWSFHAFAVLVIFNWRPRLGAFGAGVVLLWGLFASRLDYSNSRLFFGVFLILIGLQDGSKWTKGALRLQIVFLYGGAALNKLLDPAWRDGSALDHLCGNILNLANWHLITGVLPVFVFGWIVIATEALLAVGFCRRRWVTQSIWLGLVFHLGMLIFTRGQLSWIFLYAMGVAFIAIAPPIQESPVRTPTQGMGSRECWRRVVATPQFYLGLVALYWTAKYLS